MSGDLDNLLVCYAVTPDAAYRRMAAESLYTLFRFSGGPGCCAVVVELDGGGYPFGVKPRALATLPITGWTLLLDADTHVNGDLAQLMAGAILLAGRMAGEVGHTVGPSADVGARPDGCTNHPPNAAAWREVLRRCHVALDAPLYNDGAVLLCPDAARSLQIEWLVNVERIQGSCADILASSAGPKPGQWYLTMYAFSLWARAWTVRRWGPAEHSFQWQSEPPGIIHHWGAKRWRSQL